jgi:fermentation-respiration switch protein FrsA (DUF1100 family)
MHINKSFGTHKIAATLAASLYAATAPVIAQTPIQNSAVVEGASNFYKSNKVTMQRVTFKNQYAMQVVGNLFVPKDLNPDAKSPAIIVGHPMGAVKEQSSDLYAQKLSEQGFVTLAIDLSFWGESDGQPRNMVAPEIYAEDFSAAVDYLALVRISTATASAFWAFAAAGALSSAPPRSTRA